MSGFNAGVQVLDSFLKDMCAVGDVAKLVYEDHVFLSMLDAPRAATALECGIAATVAIGGLGWLIARRNALAGTEEAEAGWIQAAAEWLVQLVRGLFASVPQLPPHTGEA